MKNLWSDSEAKKYAGNPLKLRAYSSRLLGKEPNLVLHGGGNTSVKIKEKNIFNQTEDIIYVKGSGWDLSVIEPSGFAPVKLDVLKRMVNLRGISDKEMVKIQRAALTNPYSPDPSIEAIVHAIIPFTYVDHTHSDAVVTITNTRNGEARIKEIYGNRVLIVPYIKPGFTLAVKIFELIKDRKLDDFDGMILLNHGVFTFDNDAKKSYQKMIALVTEAENYLQKNAKEKFSSKEKGKENLLELTKIRNRVSCSMKKPVIALSDNDTSASSFSRIKNVEKITRRGPLTPDHIIRTKRTPVIFHNNFSKEISGYEEKYLNYFNRNSTPSLICLDLAPRWAVWKNFGTISFGQTLKDAQIVSDIVTHTISAIKQAEALGGWKTLPENDLFEIEYWELEQVKLKKKENNPEFAGKIILITGAGSGIGKACAEMFVQNGAVVSALDINSSVKGLFNRKEIFEIVCDVTDKKQIKNAVAATIRKFGGLDIVVSNAGTFSANENIEEMSDEIWNKSLTVNLTSHRLLLKECIPFLKEGIEPAVVIIGSKNVPAPGPGACAYSSAKAGLTQLARIAALELGKYGIRVNVVHPNAVYDTGIWTDEVLKGRAGHYGMTVEEYKASNVLKTNITSKDVAQMVVAIAGKTFAKTTGVQVPVDGGNERVI